MQNAGVPHVTGYEEATHEYANITPHIFTASVTHDVTLSFFIALNYNILHALFVSIFLK